MTKADKTTDQTTAPKTKKPKRPETDKPDHKELTTTALDNERKVRPHKQRLIWDNKQRTLYVVVNRGPKHGKATLSFRALYYLKSRPGIPQTIGLGRYPDGLYKHVNAAGKEIIIRCNDLKGLRQTASEIYNLAQAGVDPKRRPITGNFAKQVELYIEKYAKENNATWAETKRIFDRYVIGEWGTKDIEDIKKQDVAELLHKIGSGRIAYQGQSIGTRYVARAVRAQLSSFFNWYVEGSRSEFRTPIVRTKTWKAPPARDRSISKDDNGDELRALWQAAGEEGVYGAMIKTAVLTAQRVDVVIKMRRADLKPLFKEIAHVWDPNGGDHDPESNKQVSAVPLSALARSIINDVPIIDTAKPKDFVFSINGHSPISGLSKMKARFDKRMLAILKQQADDRGDDPDQVQLKQWEVRDLRRTARTLMAKAGVAEHVSEHCLGHKLGGVKRVYNRHDYLTEKQDAFAKLAALVEQTVQPPTPAVADSVVVPMGRRSRRRS